MEFLMQIVTVAALVGLVTDRFKKVVTNRSTMLASMVIGVALTLLYNLGLLAALGLKPAFPYGQYIDYILTGIVVSFGPNAIYDLLERRGINELDKFKRGDTA